MKTKDIKDIINKADKAKDHAFEMIKKIYHKAGAPKGRAITYSQKRKVIEQVLAAWSVRDELRLGQLLYVTCGMNAKDIFNVEDEELSALVMEYAKKEKK